MLTLDEAKNYLRVDFSDDDDLITGLISTAQTLCMDIARMEDADEFAAIDQLHALTGVAVPKNLAALRQLPVRHTDVIDKEDMLSYVLGKAGEKQW